MSWQSDSSQESGSETDLRAMSSTSDTVSTAALLAAPRGPWHLDTVPKAKPRTSRKLEPHLLPRSFALMAYKVLLCVRLGLGVADLIEGTRTVCRLCCHRERDLSSLYSQRQLDVQCRRSHRERMIENVTCILCLHMVIDFCSPLSIMQCSIHYLLQFSSTWQSPMSARYGRTNPLTTTCFASLTLRWCKSQNRCCTFLAYMLIFMLPHCRRMIGIFAPPDITTQAGTLLPQPCHEPIRAAGRQQSQTSRTGPKSGHRLSRPGVILPHFLIVLWLCLIPACTAATAESIDARVGAVSATAPEAASAAKPSGTRKASVPFKNTQPHRHVKRAYKRAFARSCREGGAHYRGQWHPMAWFEKTNLRTPSLHVRSQAQSSCPHWNVISWNAAGLTAATFQEIETFARTIRADIFMLQETKWTLESTWASQDYLYVHTAGVGKHDRLAGLLMMISTRLVKAEQLQYCVHHAGRLLHVRIPHGHTHVDLVNWYQYAVNQQADTFDRRQKLLIKLQKCLAHLPRRNSLILGGDFNCPCEQHANVCGQASIPPNPLYYADHSDHQQVWRTLHLTALNTWIHPQHGQLATFVFEGTEHQPQSQIDFIMIRSHHCTARSKQAGIIADFPAAAWRNGAKHYPVRAEAPLPRPQWISRPAQTKPVSIDQDRLLQELRADPPPPALQALRCEVQQKLQCSSQPIEDSNLILTEVAQTYYPAPAPATSTASQPEALANCAREMWRLFRLMRAQRFSASGVFTAWRTWTQYMQAHRIHKARAKERSISRKRNLLQQAQEAAAKHDARELYKINHQAAGASNATETSTAVPRWAYDTRRGRDVLDTRGLQRALRSQSRRRPDGLPL